MPSRKFDNSDTEKERARKLIRQWYQTHTGETLKWVRLKSFGLVRRKSGHLYEIARENWTAGMEVTRLATIVKSNSDEHCLVAFDVILDVRGRDTVTALTEWRKADKTKMETGAAQGRFGVTKFWKLQR